MSDNDEDAAGKQAIVGAVNRLVAEAPPLTPEQLTRLARILGAKAGNPPQS